MVAYGSKSWVFFFGSLVYFFSMKSAALNQHISNFFQRKKKCLWVKKFGVIFWVARLFFQRKALRWISTYNFFSRNKNIKKCYFLGRSSLFLSGALHAALNQHISNFHQRKKMLFLGSLVVISKRRASRRAESAHINFFQGEKKGSVGACWSNGCLWVKKLKSQHSGLFAPNTWSR